VNGPPEEKPAGAIVAVGGNEDKEFQLDVLRRICDLVVGGTRIVEVIPTASNFPKETSDAYLQAFGRIGIPEVRIMDIQTRAQARDPSLVQRILDADVVFFTGGDQLRITSLLGGSPVLNTIKGHHHRGGVVAGTSAGAAAMSAAMIYNGEAGYAMHKGTVHMTAGLGLIANVVIDSHFIHRGRFSRLLEIISCNPGHIGLGLGEDAGVIVRDGHLVETIGPGIVTVIDGHHVGYSNVSQIEMGAPIAVENITLHTLVAGHGYDLRDQRYIRPGDLKP
jgi:cyanophycinase